MFDAEMSIEIERNFVCVRNGGWGARNRSIANTKRIPTNGVSTLRPCVREEGRDREPVGGDAGEEGANEASHLNQSAQSSARVVPRRF